jgi:mono/diheme cytochrome c family protein
MKGFLLGLIFGLVMVSVCLFAYFATGFAPVATSAAPMPLERMLAKLALHARIGREMPKGSPIAGNESNYTAGANIYRTNCAVCHGLPGKPESNISKGMFPDVPQLFKHGVTDDPAGETYWKITNGIRLTGMPAFKETLSETERWQVTLLLADADKLPQSVKDGLATTTVPTP